MFFNKKNEQGEYIFDILLGGSKKNDYIYTLAEAHAIDLIAKTISKCEIQVFEKDKETKKIKKAKNELYWVLNIQPNFNETGTKFKYKLVTRLLTEKKALVIINKAFDNSKLLYIADDFKSSDSILYGKFFTDVVISDDDGNTIPMLKKYGQDDSIYYSIKNSNLNVATDKFKERSSKILNAIEKYYLKSNVPKWRLTIPGTQPTMLDAETKQPISYDEYKKKITDGLLSEDEAIVMLSSAFELINLNKDNGRDLKDLKDYKDAIKEIGDTVARTWNIPIDIFYGTKTEKSTGNDDFITFAVSNYFKLIEDGLNASLVGKKDYLKGEYIEFNKFNITHKDIIDSANGIDKLTADGFSRNEINELLGLPRIDEPWADEHNITKNYANVKGGANEDG